MRCGQRPHHMLPLQSRQLEHRQRLGRVHARPSRRRLRAHHVPHVVQQSRAVHRGQRAPSVADERVAGRRAWLLRSGAAQIRHHAVVHRRWVQRAVVGGLADVGLDPAVRRRVVGDCGRSLRPCKVAHHLHLRTGLRAIAEGHPPHGVRLALLHSQRTRVRSVEEAALRHDQLASLCRRLRLRLERQRHQRKAGAHSVLPHPSLQLRLPRRRLHRRPQLLRVRIPEPVRLQIRPHASHERPWRAPVHRVQHHRNHARPLGVADSIELLLDLSRRVHVAPPQRVRRSKGVGTQGIDPIVVKEVVEQVQLRVGVISAHVLHVAGKPLIEEELRPP
mmetsp:Transcript_13670/g.43690  ORF Transcript_13670/g.43690 Transcript_13670/m.43690 type:complete len:333 (-) Transcript_13670:1291-2289(-)